MPPTPILFAVSESNPGSHTRKACALPLSLFVFGGAQHSSRAIYFGFSAQVVIPDSAGGPEIDPHSAAYRVNPLTFSLSDTKLCYGHNENRDLLFFPWAGWVLQSCFLSLSCAMTSF